LIALSVCSIVSGASRTAAAGLTYPATFAAVATALNGMVASSPTRPPLPYDTSVRPGLFPGGVSPWNFSACWVLIPLRRPAACASRIRFFFTASGRSANFVFFGGGA
jgi:hypothetical protein